MEVYQIKKIKTFIGSLFLLVAVFLLIIKKNTIIFTFRK